MINKKNCHTKEWLKEQNEKKTDNLCTERKKPNEGQRLTPPLHNMEKRNEERKKDK